MSERSGSTVDIRRRHERRQISEAVVLTSMGVCQVHNLSEGGMSFKCMYLQELPDEWQLDILDTNGTHLKELWVEKVWQKLDKIPVNPSHFALSVGVKFKNLKDDQADLLHKILESDNLCET